MADILAQLRDKLAIAQANHAAEANKKRQPHNFQTGDRVMINTRNIPLSYGAAASGTDTDTDQSGARLSRALQQRYVGPYTLRMQRGNGNAFEITDMPEHLRIHKTYNVCEFKRCTIDESRLPPPIRVTKSGFADIVLAPHPGLGKHVKRCKERSEEEGGSRPGAKRRKKRREKKREQGRGGPSWEQREDKTRKRIRAKRRGEGRRKEKRKEEKSKEKEEGEAPAGCSKERKDERREMAPAGSREKNKGRKRKEGT
ncbi:hypothetical protein K440DRAFT_686706 [Wilcoxina mikolae CBS 423.85]|nr:hypothetical protein K440DRAFT_686706 [Wilcoxina mikolae CBS 423.85]